MKITTRVHRSAFSKFCTPRQLAGLLESRQDEVIAKWRSEASSLLRELDLSRSAIIDHLPHIVSGVTRELALGDGVRVHDTAVSSPVHGVKRFHEGLDLGEVVAEYNLLRGAFVSVAATHGFHVAGEAWRIINQHIDDAVRLAVMAFASQQALIRKEQENEHLAFVAHDLRTPLNAVSLLLIELTDGLDPQSLAESEELLEAIKRNLETVATLIERVLDAGGPADGTADIVPERRVFELRPAVQRIILKLKRGMPDSDVAVTNRIPPALTVFADASLISQVVENVIENALNQPTLGQIEVSARQEEGILFCTVRDDAATLAPEVVPGKFEKRPGTPAAGETEPGLAFAQQIVEAHGGTVIREMPPEGGPTLTFTIPKPAQG